MDTRRGAPFAATAGANAIGAAVNQGIQEIDFFDASRLNRNSHGQDFVLLNCFEDQRPIANRHMEEIRFSVLFEPYVSTSKEKKAHLDEIDDEGLDLRLSLSQFDPWIDRNTKKRELDENGGPSRNATEWALSLHLSDDHEGKKRKIYPKGRACCKKIDADDVNNNDGDDDENTIPKAKGKGVIVRAKACKDEVDKEAHAKNSSDGESLRQEQPLQQQQQPIVAAPMRLLDSIKETQQHGRSEPVLLFSKTLEKSDVDKNLNRIFITKRKQFLEALTQMEREVVFDKARCFRVTTEDPRGKEYELHLKWWHGVNMLVLNHGWSRLVRANDLRKGDTVHGWGFRQGDHADFRLALGVTKQ